jgi:hypothetical protein
VPEIANLNKWEEIFFIDRQDPEQDNLANGNIKYTEKLRLYPREIGNKVLDSIALGGAISKPVSISIKPAIRNNIDATPYWLKSPKIIWQGQTIDLSIAINLFNPSNQVAVEDAIFPFFDIKKLANKINTSKGHKSVILTWQLTAQTPGTYQLEAPIIEQRGHGRWRFYLDRKIIEVKPLPSYLPPTMAVGEVSIETKLNKGSWQINIKNKGPLANEIYGIRTQLAEISQQTIDSIHQSKEIDPLNPQINIQTYQIPIPDWSWGFGKGPELSLVYFDVKTGLLKKLKTNLQASWKFPMAFNVLFILSLITLLFFLLKTSIKMYTRYKFIQTIKAATNAHQLRKIILVQVHCITLEEWANQTKKNSAYKIAKQLNQLCYAKSSHLSLNKINSTLISILK